MVVHWCPYSRAKAWQSNCYYTGERLPITLTILLELRCCLGKELRTDQGRHSDVFLLRGRGCLRDLLLTRHGWIAALWSALILPGKEARLSVLSGARVGRLHQDAANGRAVPACVAGRTEHTALSQATHDIAERQPFEGNPSEHL